MNPPVLTVIGSGTLVPSASRSSPCCLLEAGDQTDADPKPAEAAGTIPCRARPPVQVAELGRPAGAAPTRARPRILLDVGPGAVHGMARQGKPWWAVTHVVISHYHTDHFGDLPHLLFALKAASPTPRQRPLHVLGPPGLADRAKALRAAHGDFVVDPGFEVAYHELPRDGRWADHAAGLALTFAPTPHADHSVAVRVELDGAALGYTGDTGPEPALGPFFRGVDVLVAECAHGDPPPAPGHLTPRSAAALANAARPGTLVLVHIYPPLEPSAAPDLVRAAGYDGKTTSARDGDHFPLGGARVEAARPTSPPSPTPVPATDAPPPAAPSEALQC